MDFVVACTPDFCVRAHACARRTPKLPSSNLADAPLAVVGGRLAEAKGIPSVDEAGLPRLYIFLECTRGARGTPPRRCIKLSGHTSVGRRSGLQAGGGAWG